MAQVLFVDNFDSFSYNLVDQFRQLGHSVTVFRNDYPLDDFIQRALQTEQAIIALSPGPGNPQQAGHLLPIIAKLKGKVPMIGICLGHQAIIEALGGQVVHTGQVMHGKVSRIQHDNEAMFHGIQNPMPVARYHSLMGDNLPAELVVNARFGEIVMAIRHRTEKICAFQFHPESILTVEGTKLLKQSIEWLLESKND
ncbi:aminodeoxychorismate/anthranilate synthase component II [Muribacter muris]|uniref:anthranilate synthase n=1 Tax=Muribacter muris TaxID=67855 RepID=A0A4Y9JWM7_9PAST|nr:aminodeoxychorismate/anthranilate synthase component II [Muribacter muris]MBF0785211.1 aminodeoxychorismate/anthranilate synthase component II [Muribacter muris]MBF0827375.1 aminodeoxychorismate/anthranilate synthase component II [Muribacter muris]TFV10161.1 aminodeoxychorismate/anthranilate synthase component II [Muribacter muris]